MNPFLIIIPAYNEEENIEYVLQEILKRHLKADLLIIDDGSIDQTRQIATRCNVEVISHPCNLGYGAALQTGYKYAREKNYPYIIQFDADGQHNPDDLQSIMDEIEKGEADIVMGSRFLSDVPYPIGKMKMMAVFFFRSLLRLFAGIKITDPTSGFRAIRRNVFAYYAVRGRFPSDFPDADILLQMIFRKYRIVEIPAHMRVREHGESMHAGFRPIFYMLKLMLSILVMLIRYKVVERGMKHEH